MNHISAIIEAQLASGKAFTQNRNQLVIDKSQYPKYHWELFPFMQDYYHELNPFFVSNFHKKEHYSFTDVHTVRDGRIAFANFLLTNIEYIKASKKLFLIPESFSDLIPSNVKEQFACWHLSRPGKLPITKAKRVIIFGMLLEKYLGPLDNLEKRIKQDFTSISEDTTIELLLSQRQDPFAHQNKESLIHFQVFDIIRSIFPERDLKLIKLDKFLDRTFNSDDYLYDLKYNDMVVSDSYLHYFFLSKGSSVNLIPEFAPEDAIHSLKLSFWHHLHVTPIKQVDNSLFAELLFYKKLNSRNLLQDKVFIDMISKS